MLTLQVVRRELRGEVVLLTLAHADGRALPEFTAGAHIDLHLSDDLLRPYSLCSSPQERHFYQLGVLKDSQSQGGSLAVHALREGDAIAVSEPRNLFALDEKARHSQLIGGGIGITPMLAMAAELLAAGRTFSLHYCAKTRIRRRFSRSWKPRPMRRRCTCTAAMNNVSISTRCCATYRKERMSTSAARRG